jgi:hypothetical protein
MKVLESLCSSQEASPVNANATRVYNTLMAHPLVREICTSQDNDFMDVKTHPILLKNPYGEGVLNLGCLIIRLYYNGSYEVYADASIADEVSGRDTGINSERQPHPHVSGGHVCTGNADRIIKQFTRDKDIPMFITFMLEFLQTYDKASPYWMPWFKKPCAECGQSGTSMCRWCVCAQCSSRSNDRCGGCARWKTQSAGAACAYIKNLLNNKVSQMDEDDFIDAVRKTEELFK